MTAAGDGGFVDIYPHGNIWRWTYRSSPAGSTPDSRDIQAEGVELTSAIAFTSANEAAEAAEVAYPMATVTRQDQPVGAASLLREGLATAGSFLLLLVLLLIARRGRRGTTSQ